MPCMIRYIYHHSGGMRRIRIQDINRMAPKPLRSHYRNLSPKVEATKRQENLASNRRIKTHAPETEIDDGLRRSLAKVFQSQLLELIENILGHSDTVGTEDWTICNCSSKTIGDDDFRTREPQCWLAVLRCKY